MAQGTGKTTEMLKAIEWEHRTKPAVIVVYSVFEMGQVRSLLFSLFPKVEFSKVIFVPLYHVRERLVGYKHENIFVDHHVWEAEIKNDDMRDMRDWLRGFMETGRKT